MTSANDFDHQKNLMLEQVLVSSLRLGYSRNVFGSNQAVGHWFRVVQGFATMICLTKCIIKWVEEKIIFDHYLILDLVGFIYFEFAFSFCHKLLKPPPSIFFFFEINVKVICKKKWKP